MKKVKKMMNLLGYTYKIYNRGYNTEIINKQCNTGYPLETPGRPIPRTTLYDNVNNKKMCMSNIKSCEMFDYYECQAVTVVAHVVSVQSFRLASACQSFGAGIDDWLSADSGVPRAGVA